LPNFDPYPRDVRAAFWIGALAVALVFLGLNLFGLL
jgi:hypothetical protein